MIVVKSHPSQGFCVRTPDYGNYPDSSPTHVTNSQHTVISTSGQNPLLKKKLLARGFGMSPMRILVVEDFTPFRRFICSTLGKKPGLQIIAEVSDGLEAVRQAKE